MHQCLRGDDDTDVIDIDNVLGGITAPKKYYEAIFPTSTMLKMKLRKKMSNFKKMI
jgi:hypothetical protein